MPSRSSWKWLAPAAGGLLVLAVVWAVYQASDVSGRNGSPREGSQASPSSLGEQKMSTAQQRGRIQHADDSTFEKVVLKSEVPVLVDFYADWCGPCQMLAPVLEELAAEIPNAKIVKVNIDHSPSLATEYGIDAIPNLKLFKNGTVRDGVVGLASKSQLKGLLTR